MTFPLTPSFSRDYAFHTSANSEAEFDSSVAKADNRHLERFFYVRSMIVTPLRVARVGSRKARRSFARSVNPHESAHQFDSWEAENLNRLQRSHTMSKSKRASALVSSKLNPSFIRKTASPIKSKARNKPGFQKLPFIANRRLKSKSPYWNLPATGGYFGGFATGEAMAVAYLKALRDDKIDYHLAFIVESMMVRCEQEGGSKEVVNPGDRSPEANSLRGQYCGFFYTLTKWLGMAARSFGSNLDNLHERELVAQANAGLGFDSEAFMASLSEGEE